VQRLLHHQRIFIRTISLAGHHQQLAASARLAVPVAASSRQVDNQLHQLVHSH